MQTKILTKEAHNVAKEQLIKWHKKGSTFTDDQVQAWLTEAQFQLDEGNPASFEIKSWDSVTGWTINIFLDDCTEFVTITEEQD